MDNFKRAARQIDAMFPEMRHFYGVNADNFGKPVDSHYDNQEPDEFNDENLNVD
jgi:hypothetical protein